jgi:hypothetical protein
MLPLLASVSNRFCACTLWEISRTAPAKTAPANELHAAPKQDLNFVFMGFTFLKVCFAFGVKNSGKISKACQVFLMRIALLVA